MSMRIRSFVGTHDEAWQDDRLYRHDSCEITFIMEGRGRFRTETDEIAVESGQVVLIRSGALHSFHAVTPIRFGVILADGVTGECRDDFEALLRGAPFAALRLSRAHRERYESLFRMWLRELLSPPLRAQAVYETWLRLFFVFLSEHAGAGEAAFSVTRAADYIREHLRQKHSMAELARMSGLSEDGFRKSFLKTYGMTPKQYQQRCKVAESKWMLGSTDRAVQEIGEAVGFETVHAFSAWFKKAVGVSPTEWKASLRINKTDGGDESSFG